MSTGWSKSWFVYGGSPSGMVGQACLQLAGLFESLTVASSPSHSVFEADRPNWVYRWKTLRNRRRLSIAIPSWEPVGRLRRVPFLCLQSLIQSRSVQGLGTERKRSTSCTVGIAQVEREVCVIGEGLVGMALANLRVYSIGILRRTVIGKFTSSQYKGIRPSIAD